MSQLRFTLIELRRTVYALVAAAIALAPLGLSASEDPTLHYDMNHWAFKPLKSTEPPASKGDHWSRNAVDRFVRAQHHARGLQPSPDASPRQLLRRAYFDLIGLPPTPREAAAFGADPTDKAYRLVVDRLLERPEYGERWARHWLDVARFAESHGFEQDYNRPYAYHYRDFVIRALNDDMPYNQFVRWQLAGDEIAPDNGWANVATGFLGSGVFPTQLTEAEFESARYDPLAREPTAGRRGLPRAEKRL
ncbi:MAG: DUF1549 domain-containing protein [Planctomycetota bacterium]|jgi:hypothetical protein